MFSRDQPWLPLKIQWCCCSKFSAFLAVNVCNLAVHNRFLIGWSYFFDDTVWRNNHAWTSEILNWHPIRHCHCSCYEYSIFIGSCRPIDPLPAPGWAHNQVAAFSCQPSCYLWKLHIPADRHSDAAKFSIDYMQLFSWHKNFRFISCQMNLVIHVNYLSVSSPENRAVVELSMFLSHKSGKNHYILRLRRHRRNPPMPAPLADENQPE